LAGIAAQLGTGAKGTANLNALLKRTKDACFESEGLKQKSANMDITKQRSIINNKIADLQDQMSAEKKNLTIEQTSLDAAKTQIANEGKNADEEKIKKIADLNSELSNFMDTINQQLKTSQEEQVKTEEEIKTLVLKRNVNVEPAFADASEVIQSAEDSRAGAFDSCNCSGSGAKTNKLLCDQLTKASINYDPTKKTGKSGTAISK
jgi:chromosome segregation ATPase